MPIRHFLVAAIASAPGWVVAYLLDAPLVGWTLAAAGIAVALGLLPARRVTVRVPTRDAVAVASSAVGWTQLEREVARARRYGQSLTLAYIADTTTDPIPLADIVARCREVDMAWEDDGIWLMAVGADEVDREPLLARLRREIATLGADQIRALSFPGDAMTVRALVAGLSSDSARPIRLPVRSHPADPPVDRTLRGDALPAAVERGQA